MAETIAPETQTWAPATIKDNPGLSKFKTQEDLEKGYIELEKSYGGSTSVPAVDAPAAEWDAFYSKVGRPEKADGYKIELPKFEGVDYKVPDETVKGFLAEAHKAGLTGKQAQTLMNWWGGETTKELQKI